MGLGGIEHGRGPNASTGNVRQDPVHGFGGRQSYLAGGIRTVSTM